MKEFILILEFFGGLILLFAIGYLLGLLFKLENHIKK